MTHGLFLLASLSDRVTPWREDEGQRLTELNGMEETVMKKKECRSHMQKSEVYFSINLLDLSLSIYLVPSILLKYSSEMKTIKIYMLKIIILIQNQ